MADRYAQRWDDDERRPPYESRYRERDWGYGGRSDRAFFERFLDELRSWFGDEEAQRRRMADERDDARHRGEWNDRERDRDWGRERSEWDNRGDWQRVPSDRDWNRQGGYVEGRRPWERGYGSTLGSYAGSSGYGTWGRERDWTRDQPWGGQGPGGFGTYGPHAGRGPRNYQRADERIREDVCERLAQHGYLDPSDVEIVVLNGDVTLQGSVNDRWAKRSAEEVAEGVWGVKQVHNQLRLGQEPFRQDRPSQEGQSRSPGQPRNWAA